MTELTTGAAIIDEGKVESIQEPVKKELVQKVVPVCETCYRPFSRPGSGVQRALTVK